MNMTWCCDPFRNAATNLQGDGFVIYAVASKSPHADPQFGFAFRSVRTDDLPKLRDAVAALSGQAPANIKLTGAFRFRFCPWCGVRLAEYYSSSFMEFVDEDLRREFEFI